MNIGLLECKRKTKLLVASEDAPRNGKGRKKGYMAVLKDIWEEAVYAELNLTSQIKIYEARWLARRRLWEM